MSRFFRRHVIRIWIALLGMPWALAGPAKASGDPAVPWLDLVRESEMVVVGRIESVQRPGGRVERSVLRVEESWMGQPPERITLRLRAPRSELRAAGVERLPKSAAVAPAGALAPGARVLVFLKSAGSDRLEPVRGAEGILPLTASSEAADRRLVSLLLLVGEELERRVPPEDRPERTLLSAAEQ